MKMFHTLKFRSKTSLSDAIGYKLFYTSLIGKIFPNDARVFWELIGQVEPVNFHDDVVKLNTMFLATMMVQSRTFEKSNLVTGLALAFQKK